MRSMALKMDVGVLLQHDCGVMGVMWVERNGGGVAWERLTGKGEVCGSDRSSSKKHGCLRRASWLGTCWSVAGRGRLDSAASSGERVAIAIIS